MTIKELTDEFIRVYAIPRLRPSTIRGYKTNIEKHILPEIGDREISKINAAVLDDLNASFTDLSNKSKVYIHATLRKTLNFAVKRGYLINNPYKSFDLPKAEKYSYKTLSEEEMHRMLALIKGTIIEAPVTMALCYGLRRGECLAITKEDIDKETNILHIRKTRYKEHGCTVITPCKTEESKRYILLEPTHTKMLLGEAGRQLPELSPDMLNYHFKQFLKQNAFQEIRFHDLRHSYATLMMKKGVNPKIVSAILGHSKIDTTLDIYSHPDVSMQQICIDMIRRGIKQKSRD